MSDTANPNGGFLASWNGSFEDPGNSYNMGSYNSRENYFGGGGNDGSGDGSGGSGGSGPTGRHPAPPAAQPTPNDPGAFQTAGGSGGGFTNFASWLAANPTMTPQQVAGTSPVANHTNNPQGAYGSGKKDPHFGGSL